MKDSPFSLLRPSVFPLHRLPSEPTERQPKRDASNDPSFGTNRLIGWILQGGVLLRAVLIVFGLALLPSRLGGLSLQRLLTFPQTLDQVGAGLLLLRPQAFITLGLLVLIATPIVRVAASVLVFAVMRDRRFILITLLVLTLLLLSLFLGATYHSTVSVDATSSSTLGFALCSSFSWDRWSQDSLARWSVWAEGC